MDCEKEDSDESPKAFQQNVDYLQGSLFDIEAMQKRLKDTRKMLFGDFIQYPAPQPPPVCDCQEKATARLKEEHKEVSNCDCGKENCGCECCACCYKVSSCEVNNDKGKEEKPCVVEPKFPECLKKVKFIVQHAEVEIEAKASVTGSATKVTVVSCSSQYESNTVAEYSSNNNETGGADVNNNEIIGREDVNNNSLLAPSTSAESIVVSELRRVDDSRDILPYNNNLPMVSFEQVVTAQTCMPFWNRRGESPKEGILQKRKDPQSGMMSSVFRKPHKDAQTSAQKETKDTATGGGTAKQKGAQGKGGPDKSNKGNSQGPGKGKQGSKGSKKKRSCSRPRCCYYSTDCCTSDPSSSEDECPNECFPSEFLWFMLTMNSTAQYYKYTSAVQAAAAAEAAYRACPCAQDPCCCQPPPCCCDDGDGVTIDVNTLDELIEREGLNSFMDKEVTLTLKPFSGDYIPENPLVDLKALKMFAHGEKETEFCMEIGGECECDKKSGKCCGGKKKDKDAKDAKDGEGKQDKNNKNNKSDSKEECKEECCSIQLPPAPPCCCPNKAAEECCARNPAACAAGCCGPPVPCAPSCGGTSPPPPGNCSGAPAPYNQYPGSSSPCSPYNCYPYNNSCQYPSPPYPGYPYPYPGYPYSGYNPYYGYPYPGYPPNPYNPYGYSYPPPPPPPYGSSPGCAPGYPNPCSQSPGCASPLEMALTLGVSLGMEKFTNAFNAAYCDQLSQMCANDGGDAAKRKNDGGDKRQSVATQGSAGSKRPSDASSKRSSKGSAGSKGSRGSKGKGRRGRVQLNISATSQVNLNY